MKWINSLDDLLYEVMSWLVFFPMTLWRSIVRPLAMMDYADDQLALPEEDRYSAVLSPPLFLVLAMLVAHGFSIALGEADTLVGNQHGLAGLVNDEPSALAIRVIVFATLALFAAIQYVRKASAQIDRQSLRIPFYAQCYPTAVLALGLGLGTSLATFDYWPAPAIGAAIVIASLLNFVMVEIFWFSRKLSINYLWAFGNVILILIEGFAVFVVVGSLLAR